MQKNKLLVAAQEVLATQENFARRFLIHKPLQMVLPPIPLQEHFRLPRNPAYHFVVMDGITRGPDGADWRLASCERKMPIQTILQLTREDGNPTRLAGNLQTEIDMYLRTQRRFRKSRDVTADDPGDGAAVIYNYAQLYKQYRYARNMFTELYRWTNIWSTVIDTIRTAESERTHLLFSALPKRLPGMQFMTKLVDKPLQAQLRDLPDPDARFLYELWKWIDPATRSKSIFAPLDQAKLDKTVIIFEDAGRTMGVNLGLLNSWIKDPAVAYESNRDKYMPMDVQKRIIRGIIGLMQQRVDASGVDDFEDAEASNEVRILTAADDLPQDENASDESFTQRATAILANLDDDIAAHDQLQEETIVEDEDPSVRGVSITERGDNAAIKSFEQVGKQDIADKLQNSLDDAADRGLMTVMEYRKFNRFMAAAMSLESPYGGGMTAAEFGKVDPNSTNITDPKLAPEDGRIVDQSMRSKVFDSLDGDYVRNTLQRDLVGCVQAVQNAGYIVTAHSVERIEDISGAAEMHSIRLQPIEGAASPLRFKCPVIDQQGRITSNGVDYRFRRQRVDLPIRKINEYQVALSSYFGKTFVSRCDRSAYNYNRWLQKNVSLMLADEKSVFSQVHTGDCFVHTAKAPRGFTAMAQQWRDMVLRDVQMLFNLEHQQADFGDEAIAFATNLNMTLFGKGLGARKGVLYAMDENNAVYTIHDGNVEPVSSFEAFLGIDESTRPVEFTECRVFGKNIPSGVVLGYYYGLSGLVKMLGARVRQVPAGTRANPGPGEWTLVFEDYTLVFSQEDRVASLILSGLNQAAKTLRLYSMFHFDKPAVYFNVMERLGLGGRYLRELDMLRDLFVDPITERVLIKMGEPTTYAELVHRATQMLLDERYKRPLDNSEQRYRGAERIPGAVYSQMVQAVREHRAKASRATARVEMNPYAIHKHVMSDPSLTMVKDINPVENVKSITAVTYTGHGGRSVRSMPRNLRAMDPSDQGVLSEATVDSSQVGFNAYLSMAPRLANTEGMPLPPTGPASPHASLLSPGALLSAAINSDDGKRIGMSSIQHSHTIACSGYRRNVVNTGMERALAHQVDDTFATTARADGKVKSMNRYGLVVEFADGTTQAVALGRRFGAAAGMTLPHDMTTQFDVGDVVKAGDVLAYHKGFFAPDPFKKGAVDWMNGTIARFAFPDTRETHEDASSISQDFAKKIVTQVTRPINVIVRFDEVVHNLVKPGQRVHYSDNLCLIESQLAAKSQHFSEDRLNTLKLLSGPKNTAQVSGVVDRVEVLYHGHPDDMSESLREIVDESDRQLARIRRGAGKTVVTGLTDDGTNIEGEPLQMDTACIRVYITHDVAAGVGDKGVICWQLKTEISKVYYKRTTLLDGKPVDGFYGSKSLFARVVYSAFKVGTTTTLSGIISYRMAEIYKGIRK